MALPNVEKNALKHACTTWNLLEKMACKSFGLFGAHPIWRYKHIATFSASLLYISIVSLRWYFLLFSISQPGLIYAYFNNQSPRNNNRFLLDIDAIAQQLCRIFYQRLRVCGAR